MTGTTLDTPKRSPSTDLGIALAACSGLAAAMGIGRFVYTPLLPVMTAAHQIDSGTGALIATANYLGYLLGALLLTWRPEWNNRTVFRLSAAALVLSETLMIVPGPTIIPATARLIAGVASAVIFVGSAGVAARPGSGKTAAGVAFAGVGVGIAVAGAFVLMLQSALSWQALWLVSALLTAILLLPALTLDIRPGTRTVRSNTPAGIAWRALLVAYFLEGVGYIVIGTFLVAAIREQHGPTLGALTWVIVGAVGAPATIAWGVAARRWNPAYALPVALLAQCVSAILPVLSGSMIAAVVAAAGFGATFMGIVMLVMRVGTELTHAGAAAPLTALYGAGQILGPLVVAPVLGTSFSPAFVIATGILILGTLAAVVVTREVRRT